MRAIRKTMPLPILLITVYCSLPISFKHDSGDRPGTRLDQTSSPVRGIDSALKVQGASDGRNNTL